jgi:DNA-binding transcriptional MerR regulator
VLELLRPEFPTLTISKLRYLEDQGLIAPQRTASGYRRYSEDDVDRVAWVLVQQRDNFLPLKVIRARLAAIDAAGGTGLTAVRRPRSARLDAEDVATVTGQDAGLVEAVAEAAGVPVRSADAALIQAVEAVADLANFGLELRHLRPVFQSVARQADLVELATHAVQGRGSAAAERAAAAAAECADALARLDAALLRLKVAHP